MPTNDDRFARRATLGFLLFGIAIRLIRYCLDFPLWGDEVFVCQNFWSRDFATILQQLENGQICPPLFLWCQLAAFKVLGTSELAMRFFPMFAAILALVAFRKLACAILAPMPAMIAIGLLSVAAWPVTMSTFAKPYSFDLLMAAVLQLLAVRCFESRGTASSGIKSGLALLAFAMPVAILGSYPAVFVGGAVMLAVVPGVWRSSGSAAKLWYALAGILMLAAFAFDLQVGKEQFEGEAVPIRNFLLDYWKDAFPPAEWWKWPLWLLEAHTGRMLAYPVGDAHGGSTLTFIFFCVGIYRWCREKRGALLVLFLVPFALNLIAAIQLKYPYAACGRLTQHLAPAICLLTATGIAHAIEWRFKLPETRRFVLRIVVGLYVAIGVVTVGMALARQYHGPEAKWMRDIPREIEKRADGRRDAIWVLGEERDTPTNLRWYLKRMMPRAKWLGRGESSHLHKDDWRVWIIDPWADDGKVIERIPHRTRLPEGYVLRAQTRYDYRPDNDTDSFFHCLITVYGMPDSPPVVLSSGP